MQKQKNNATKETRIKSSFWGDAWRRLKQDRAAVVALCVLVLLILCGIFASYIGPIPMTCRIRPQHSSFPMRSTCWVRITSAVTF